MLAGQTFMNRRRHVEKILSNTNIYPAPFMLPFTIPISLHGLFSFIIITNHTQKMLLWVGAVPK